MRKKFCSNIVFTKTPLKSRLFIDDFFQIYPIKHSDAPQSENASYYPVVLEFWINEHDNPTFPNEMEDLKSIEDILSPTINQVDKLNRITRLLSTVTNHRFISENETDVKWGVPFSNLKATEEEAKRLTSSIPFIPIYYFENMGKSLKIEKFSEVSCPDPILIEHQEYYTYDPFENKKSEIKFPETVYRVLNSYRDLTEPDKNFIDSVCHLICNGIDIESKMKSLSFLAFVSAIESLVNREYKDQNKAIEFECRDCQTIKESVFHCNKCERPIWGVKAKFREFLRTYVAYSQESTTKFNKIYNLRSEIVHNGMLLLGDKENDLVSTPKSEKQWEIHMETKQLARLSLIHYLLMGSGKTISC